VDIMHVVDVGEPDVCANSPEISSAEGDEG
jgi:hypothetical protein